MRVIGGSTGGHKIFTPGNIRPTRGKVREALFSIIDVRDRVFVDLYAGSGAVGIEALSRGASRVIFVERSRKAIECIKRNLDKTGFEAEIIDKTVISALNNFDIECDYIFMDPPYNSGLVEKTLKKIDEIMKNESVVIIEYRTQYPPDYNGFREIKRKEYGDSSLLFLKR